MTCGLLDVEAHVGSWCDASAGSAIDAPPRGTTGLAQKKMRKL